MVQSHRYNVQFIHRNIEDICQIGYGSLSAVAQPHNLLYAGVLDHSPADHHHRVAVIQKNDFRAAFLHLPAYFEEYGDAPEPREQAAGAGGITGGLEDPILGRDGNIQLVVSSIWA